MDAPSWLIAGLGNPGPDYADNRHNIGFMIVDLLATRWGVQSSAFRSKFGSELAQTDVRLGAKTLRVHLQKPMEFMNLSGGPVQRAMAFFRIAPSNLVVIHDEIDLPFLRLRVKVGGGHGGHNGLRSISQAIGPDYLRVRAGVGRPGGSAGIVPGQDVSGHVLGPFRRAEEKQLPDFLAQAADAVQALLQHGPAYAMNHFNKDLQSASIKE